MKEITFRRKQIVLGLFLFCLLFLAFQSTPIKIKVVVDNASVKATPQIGGKTLAKVPLETILVAEEKEGEWYRVTLEAEGIQISGFIHEMLVEVYKEEIPGEGKEIQGAAEKSEAEIVAEIEIKMEENRNLIRQEKDLEGAVHSLRPLIAKAFNITDDKRQKEIAAEIFLWIGIAYASEGEAYSALKEFKNMFEVDQAYAKEITRNIYNPEVISLIEHAERQYLGLVSEYSLEISTEPKEAMIKIDGKEIGLSPEVYRTSVPKFMVEIEKEGYKSIREEVFLTQETAEKEYILESLGRKLDIKSDPKGASVYLNEEDTDQLTDCILPFVPFGRHKINLKKDHYADWEEWVEIKEGTEPVSITAILTEKDYRIQEKWGKPGGKFFQEPTGIALDGADNFYIVDSSDFKIKKFDSEGSLMTNWGDRGKAFKVLKNPGGIAVDNEGFLYVTDTKNNSFAKFQNNGRLIKKWGEEGTGDQQFMRPIGIAVDRNNDIYIADSGNNRIKKYSHLGVLKKIWGRRGTSDGEFIYPVAVAVNGKEEVFVVDRFRIQKFSSEGKFIAGWGKPGTAEGEMYKPMGIFIDRHNYIYLADSGNHRIQKFDQNGKFITTWGNKGIADGQLNFPIDVAVNSKGLVFVVERDNDRVQRFGVLTQ